MRKELSLGLLLVACGSTVSAAALEDHDANGDGKLSKDEFHSTVSDVGIYGDWDRNGDGVVDAAEFDDTGAEGDFDAWDSDADGHIDSGEFYEKAFKDFDSDEDGEWDSEEWDNAKGAGWLEL